MLVLWGSLQGKWHVIVVPRADLRVEMVFEMPMKKDSDEGAVGAE